MKKTISLVIGIAVLVSSFTACNNKQGSAPPVTKEELDPAKIGHYSTLELPFDKDFTEITMLCDTSAANLNDSLVVNEIRKRTGVNLKIVEVPRSIIQEKSKVLLASKNEMPDIFGGYAININEYGVQGAFEPIDGYIDELPNLKEIFFTKAEEHDTIDKLKNLRASDGKLYMFPSYDTNRPVNSGVMYRQDIFEKHNIPLWNGPDEFYNVLKQLKTLYPSSTPLAIKSKLGFLTRLGESWGIGFTDFGTYYDETEKTWKHMVTDPKFKEILDYTKKLFDEGLLDPEFLTVTDASWTAKMTRAEEAFVTNDWIGRMDLFKNGTTVPDYNLSYGPPIGPTGKVISLPLVSDGPGIKKSKNSLLAMKVCDYLISPSGAQLVTMGIEGTTYEMGEDGFAKYKGFAEGEPVNINTLEDKYGMFISSLYRRFDHRSVYYNYTPKEKQAQDLMLNKKDGFEPEDPKLSFTEEEKDKITEYAAKIKTSAEEFASKYIITKTSGDAEWQAWLKQAETLKTNEVVDVYNTAQKRYDSMDK